MNVQVRVTVKNTGTMRAFRENMVALEQQLDGYYGERQWGCDWSDSSRSLIITLPETLWNDGHVMIFDRLNGQEILQSWEVIQPDEVL